MSEIDQKRIALLQRQRETVLRAARDRLLIAQSVQIPDIELENGGGISHGWVSMLTDVIDELLAIRDLCYQNNSLAGKIGDVMSVLELQLGRERAYRAWPMPGPRLEEYTDAPKPMEKP